MQLKILPGAPFGRIAEVRADIAPSRTPGVKNSVRAGRTMAVDTSDLEIPVALREAFAEALAVFSDWERGDEPKVVFDGRPTAISRVFFWTTGFDDAIPG